MCLLILVLKVGKYTAIDCSLYSAIFIQVKHLFKKNLLILSYFYTILSLSTFSYLFQPPTPNLDAPLTGHLFGLNPGLRQHLLSAAAAGASAASTTSPVSPQRSILSGKRLDDSSPSSSLDRARSPIDLDDTSNEGVTSPKNISGNLGSAFRQVKPIHATLPSGNNRRASPDSDEGPTAKREKHVWRPY